MEDTMLSTIVEKYQTPIYVYDGDKIALQYRMLKNALPHGVEIFYSMKANPLLGICQLLRKLGSRIEIASSGELYTALEAGFSPSKIIFTSPGKTCEELEYAIETDIFCINIESVEEAQIINRIAVEKSKQVNISIRINPDFNIAGSSIKMAGVPAQFGIDQIQLNSAFDILKTLPGINIIGIHVYTGTQLLSAQNIIFCMEQILALALEVSEKYQFKLLFLDLGGGFGVPYFKGEAFLDLELLKEGLVQIWDSFKHRLSQTQIAVESGRFLMAESGLYLTKVLYKKACKGNLYVICDGGSNQHASSAFLGRHIRNNFPMHVLNKSTNEEEVNVVGPLCTPTDIIGQKVILPEVNSGDIIVIEKSGAYGITQSPAMFLSHPLPTEVAYIYGETYVLRERGKKEDFIREQKSLTL
ncbi:MAG: type III PLP-dependent enzyme [Ruminiclostridium sp.]